MMYLDVTGPPRRISMAGRRLPSRVTARRCEMTASSEQASCDVAIERSSGGTIARMRSIVWAAFELCTVAKTWWPVSAARRAIRIVSLSRSSPTRITSGSCRSACLSPCSNDGVSWPTSSCEIMAFWLVCTYSTGSSIVMILQRNELLSRSTIAARVVLLPLPVVPVSRVIPRSDRVMSRKHGRQLQLLERPNLEPDDPQHHRRRTQVAVDVAAEPGHARDRVAKSRDPATIA